jgi:hypothetical protein
MMTGWLLVRCRAMVDVDDDNDYNGVGGDCKLRGRGPDNGGDVAGEVQDQGWTSNVTTMVVVVVVVMMSSRVEDLAMTEMLLVRCMAMRTTSMMTTTVAAVTSSEVKNLIMTEMVPVKCTTGKPSSTMVRCKAE